MIHLSQIGLDPDLAAKLQGPMPLHSFTFDGCTCSPDFVGAVDCRPACAWHDFAYSVGGDKKQRALADRRFWHNLRLCGLSRFWAGLYYRRVRLHGGRHFNWRQGETDYPVWRLFLTRFLQF